MGATSHVNVGCACWCSIDGSAIYVVSLCVLCHTSVFPWCVVLAYAGVVIWGSLMLGLRVEVYSVGFSGVVSEYVHYNLW